MIPTVHTVSWNLTRRCNLECAHCYISACRGPGSGDELSTEACRSIMASIARVNPRALLILTGGEPLLRTDLPVLAATARDLGFTVVVGSNGLLLREGQARMLREHGVQGVSLSLDSTDARRHDAFRHHAGAWDGAVRAAHALRAEGLDFSIHMTVAAWNAEDVPAMIDLAAGLGAKVLNVFFLVQAGRGAVLTELSPDRYEALLTYLAKLPADPSLVVRAKCAPMFQRIVWQLDPSSPRLRNYADGACPAGKHYCRITPEGEITPCPYMAVVAGNLGARERTAQGFEDVWRQSEVFGALRSGGRGGRCGECEFSTICGGCRCRAYAATGDYMAEDPACTYEPGMHGRVPIALPAEQSFGVEVACELDWDEDACGRLDGVPSFARGMVVRAVEAYARSCGHRVVTSAMMREVRQRWGARFAPRGAC